MFSSDAKAGLWSRLATTFGPTVAGLLGGGLAGLLALATIAPLGRNVAATYAHFPSLQRPWLAADLDRNGLPALSKATLRLWPHIHGHSLPAREFSAVEPYS